MRAYDGTTTPGVFSGTATPANGVFSGAATPAYPSDGRQEDLARGLTGRLNRHLGNARKQVSTEVAARRNAIGGIDQMWLLMADATDFSPVCASTYTFKGKMTREKLRSVLEIQSDKFPKYRQRLSNVRRKLHGAGFEDAPDFDVDKHIREIHLPGKAGKKEFDAALSKFLSEDWDYSRPLWDVLLIDNYTDEDGAESAMITRGHHTLADGQGFVLSQLWITSYKPELEKMMNGNRGLSKKAAAGKALPSELDKRLKPLDSFAKGAITGIFVQLIMAALFWAHGLSQLLEGIFWSLINIFHVGRLYLWVSWRSEMVTASYRGPRVPGREASSSKPFPISDVKICQRAFSGLAPGSMVTQANGGKSKAADRLFHVTLNDIICACMSDVLAEEMSHVKPTNGLIPRFQHAINQVFRPPIGFFIPISIRAPGQWDMRNLSTGALVYLQPLKHTDAKPNRKDLYHHIHGAKKELNVVKQSLLPRLTFNAVQYSIAQAPILFPTPGALLPGPFRKYIVEPIFDFVMSSFPAILTNVPGPHQSTVSLAEVEILRWTALPPQAGKGTIGIGVISYAKTLSISVAADSVRETRGVAARICERFEDRFQAYLEVAKEILAEAEYPETTQKIQ